MRGRGRLELDRVLSKTAVDGEDDNKMFSGMAEVGATSIVEMEVLIGVIAIVQSNVQGNRRQIGVGIGIFEGQFRALEILGPVLA